MERDLIPLGKEAYYIRVWLREMGGTFDHEHNRWLIPLSLREEAERRLRDVRPLGRAGEVTRLGDGDEIAELVQFHRLSQWKR